MRPVLLAVLASVTLAGCADPGALNPFATRDASDAPITTGSIGLDVRKATDAVNDYRAKTGLSTVALDPELVSLARQQARAMARSGRVSHDIAGSLRERMDKAGVRVAAGAENIAAGQDSLDDALAAWKGSPGHERNLKLDGATRFGIAVAVNPSSPYKTFWAMLIATDPPAAN